MDAKKKIWFPSAAERIAKMYQSIGRDFGSSDMTNTLDLTDPHSEMPDSRSRPLVYMELINELRDLPADRESREQVFLALVAPNNAEGLFLDLEAEVFGMLLKGMNTVISRELAAAGVTTLHPYRLTDYESAYIGIGAPVRLVRPALAKAAEQMRYVWQEGELDAIALPTNPLYYPKVPGQTLLFSLTDWTDVDRGSALFWKCRQELRQQYGCLWPPRLPSFEHKCSGEGKLSFHDLVRQRAELWDSHGRQPADLAKGDFLVAMYCWLSSPGMMYCGFDSLLADYWKQSHDQSESEYFAMLRKRFPCTECHETYMLDNLKI
ncbi:MAG TPA: hypothetical protein PKO06_11340, partial [Candidatus Ozemobacteraceae bacterium]|nr:hypothetical protein [Candidatus Ozemobacteraceae bacterium]